MKRRRLIVDEALFGSQRVDCYLASQGLLSRSQIRRSLLEVSINGKKVKLSRHISAGDVVDVSWEELPSPEIISQKLLLSILFEDERVIVVNKAAGMVVHPAAGHYEGTLVQGLLWHCEGLAARFGGERVRPGIVHRLDKETSGVLIAAKDPQIHTFLADQFAKRQVSKRYLAIVEGILKRNEGVIESFLTRDKFHRKRFTVTSGRGKYARSSYRLLQKIGNRSLVELTPFTGRTHQLRVHMQFLGHPIVGDSLYGKPSANGLMLHSWSLSLFLPKSEKLQNFIAPIPQKFVELCPLLLRKEGTDKCREERGGCQKISLYAEKIR